MKTKNQILLIIALLALISLASLPAQAQTIVMSNPGGAEHQEQRV